MCQTYKVLPDDPFIVDMDPIQRMYLFYHWVEDLVEKNENAKNHAYLIGGFSNPEMLKKILDENNVIETSDDDFEKTLRMVKEENIKSEDNLGKKRKRRKKLGN